MWIIDIIAIVAALGFLVSAAVAGGIPTWKIAEWMLG